MPRAKKLKLIMASDEYQLAMDTGIVRVECKFGAHYLRENNQRYLGDLEMGKLIALFDRETAPLLLARAEQSVRLVDAMPRKLRMSALSWIDGRDMRSILPRTTFKTHRKALLEYGLDITEPRNLANGRPNAEEALQRMLDALPQHSLKVMPCPTGMACRKWIAAPHDRKNFYRESSWKGCQAQRSNNHEITFNSFVWRSLFVWF